MKDHHDDVIEDATPKDSIVLGKGVREKEQEQKLRAAQEKCRGILSKSSSSGGTTLAVPRTSQPQRFRIHSGADGGGDAAEQEDVAVVEDQDQDPEDKKAREQVAEIKQQIEKLKKDVVDIKADLS